MCYQFEPETSIFSIVALSHFATTMDNIPFINQQSHKMLLVYQLIVLPPSPLLSTEEKRYVLYIVLTLLYRQIICSLHLQSITCSIMQQLHTNTLLHFASNVYVQFTTVQYYQKLNIPSYNEAKGIKFLTHPTKTRQRYIYIFVLLLLCRHLDVFLIFVLLLLCRHLDVF